MCTDAASYLRATTHESEQAYFGDLAGVPRFDRDRETELASAVVRTRRAYWSILLNPTELPSVLEAIVSRAKDERIVALANELRAQRSDGCEVEPMRRALADALDRAGDEHAVADGIVAAAADIDRQWHAAAQRARTAYRAARNRFVEANLRLVVAFAKRHGNHLLPLVDRIQEGNIGLMKAVDRFDPERGVRFSTYASWWIRHAIMRALSTGGRTVRIPPQIQVLFAKAERARRRLAGELGREPDSTEIAAAVGCEPERIEWATRTMQIRSVSFDARPGDEPDLSEALSDETSLAALENAVDGRDRERAVTALRGLPARERAMLQERYGFPGAPRATLREIGRRHGVSRERARQIQKGALDQLRRTLDQRS